MDIDFLDRELHEIAMSYHWERDTIVSLPIRKRKKYFKYILLSKRAEIKNMNGDVGDIEMLINFYEIFEERGEDY